MPILSQKSVNLSLENELPPRHSFRELLDLLQAEHDREIQELLLRSRHMRTQTRVPLYTSFIVDIDTGLSSNGPSQVAEDLPEKIETPSSVCRMDTDRSDSNHGLLRGATISGNSLTDLHMDETWLTTIDFEVSNQEGIFADSSVQQMMQQFIDNTDSTDSQRLSRQPKLDLTMTALDITTTARKHCALQFSVIHPASRKKMLWDIVGFVFLVYHLVIIPMQIFNGGPLRFKDGYITFEKYFEGFSTCYWTLDIFISFFTGYFTFEGFVELRLKQIITKYMKTWFALDFVLVLGDYLTYTLGVVSNTGILRIGKTLGRIMRILKLLRFKKMSQAMNDMLDRINSEYILTFIGVSKILVMIVFLNHYIACGWYGLTRWNSDNRSWLDRIHSDLTEENKKSIPYLYITSLHWSLTQFTPASMEVVPQNFSERLYNVIIIIMGMVAFSSFVSSITGAMTYIRIINQKTNEQNASVRKFFRDNDISQELASRVWFCQQKSQRAHGCASKMEISLFKAIPVALKNDLLLELYSPTMSCHPIFKMLSWIDSGALREVCSSEQTIIQVEAFADVQKQYHRGRLMETMFFVVEGTLEYTLPSKTSTKKINVESAGVSRVSRVSTYSFSDRIEVGVNEWACEAALWLAKVKLPGTFKAASQKPHLMVIGAKEFKDAIAQFPVALIYLSRYAHKFCHDFLNNSTKETDIIINDEVKKDKLEVFAQQALQEIRAEIFNRGLAEQSINTSSSGSIKLDGPFRLLRGRTWDRLWSGSGR